MSSFIKKDAIYLRKKLNEFRKHCSILKINLNKLIIALEN